MGAVLKEKQSKPPSLASGSFTSYIVCSYTIPYIILLILFITHILLFCLYSIFDHGTIRDTIEYFIAAEIILVLPYTVHKLVAEFKEQNVLAIIGECFLLFPLHFIWTLVRKIRYSRRLIKLDISKSDEMSSLLDKIRPSSPFHTCLIILTCVAMPLIMMDLRPVIDLYLHTRGILNVCKFSVALSIMMWGTLYFFRYETYNMSRLSFENVSRILQLTSEDVETRLADETPAQDCEGEVPKANETAPPSSATKFLVAIIILLHCYTRMFSLQLVNGYMRSDLIFYAHPLAFFLILMLCKFRFGVRISLLYAMLQSVILNFCLVEYKVRVKKPVFVGYFLTMAVENLFIYIKYRNMYCDWVWDAHSSEFIYYYGKLYTTIVAQIVQFALLVFYLVWHTPEEFEIVKKTPVFKLTSSLEEMPATKK